MSKHNPQACWDRMARMVGTLLALAENPDGRVVDYLAARHAVSRRTVYRDLDALKGVGIGIDRVAAGPTSTPIYRLRPGARNAALSLATFVNVDDRKSTEEENQ